jgi:spermidine synthase
VLVIGGGLGGLCQQMLEFGVGRLDYVEPDPALITLLYRHLPPDLREPLSDQRFSAYLCDGRYFVRRAVEGRPALARRMLGREGEAAEGREPAGAYDLVVVNIGDPVSASGSRFYTVEFCRELQRILREEGVAAFCGITGSENYLAGGPVLRYGAAVHKTLRAAFDTVVVRPGDELCFFAGASASAEPDVLVERFERQELTPDVLKHGFRLAEFPPERATWVKELFRDAAPAVPVNTDAQPVLFTLFLGVQHYYARGAEVRGGDGGPFSAVRSLPRASLWAPLAVVPLLVGLVRLLRRHTDAVAWGCRLSVFATGVFGLSAEMLIVYRYQTSFGYVYRDVSILVGLFMLGLALGGWLMGRRRQRRDRSVLLAVGGGQATFLLGLPASLGLLSASPPAFMLASSMAGFLTGAEFPLAARISLGTGARPGTVAGSLDAADHLGALAGAACTGLLLVPALGVVQTAAVVALLKCAALGGLVLAFTPERRS